MTRVDYEAPARALPSEDLERLRAWLENQRLGIVRAHYVVEVHAAQHDWPETRHATLAFELVELPEWTAPKELWRAVMHTVPSVDLRGDRGGGFTFASRRQMPAIQAVSSVLWERDPALPPPVPATLELVVDQPDVPADLHSDLRAHFEALPKVRRASFIRERLFLDGEEIWSEVALRINRELEPPGSEEETQVAEAVLAILRPHLKGVGLRWSSDPRAVDGGLVVFDRGLS